MIRRALVIFTLAFCALSPATAQQRVTVGTMRQVSNGALFLAAARGYFKAEGLDITMLAYPNAEMAVQELAAGKTQFVVVDFSAEAFKLAGKGAIKAIAAQTREQQSFEGNAVLASNAAYMKGLRKFDDLAARIIAIDSLGSPSHYELGHIAEVKGFTLKGLALKSQVAVDDIAKSLAADEIDAAILPPQNARELLLAGQARLIGWYSEIDEAQLGALFVAGKVLEAERPLAEKFLHAYQRGAADYAAALLRHDSRGKRKMDELAHAAAAQIAHYVYPKYDAANAGPLVEGGAYYMDAQAKLDVADLARQIAWYKTQGLIDSAVEARDVVDLNLTAHQ